VHLLQRKPGLLSLRSMVPALFLSTAGIMSAASASRRRTARSRRYWRRPCSNCCVTGVVLADRSSHSR